MGGRPSGRRLLVLGGVEGDWPEYEHVAAVEEGGRQVSDESLPLKSAKHLTWGEWLPVKEAIGPGVSHLGDVAEAVDDLLDQRLRVRVANTAPLFAEVLASHRDMQMLSEGMWADGEVALLRCTCGWSMNVPIDDDMLPAVPIWEKHQAEQLAKAAGR